MELKMACYSLAFVVALFLFQGGNAQLVITPTTASVAENSPQSSSVQDLTASGGTGTITYTLTDTKFEIATAQLRVKSGASDPVLDFESTPTITITFTATDSTTPTALTTTVTFTVSLTNVNEAPNFAMASYSVTLTHGAGAGSAVGTFTATDPDAGDSVASYAIFSGNDGTTFTNTNGAITVASGKTLDSTTQSAYILVFHALDSAPLTGSTTIYIAVCPASGAGSLADATYLGFMALLGIALVQAMKYM